MKIILRESQLKMIMEEPVMGLSSLNPNFANYPCLQKMNFKDGTGNQGKKIKIGSGEFLGWVFNPDGTAINFSKQKKGTYKCENDVLSISLNK